MRLHEEAKQSIHEDSHFSQYDKLYEPVLRIEKRGGELREETESMGVT